MDGAIDGIGVGVGVGVGVEVGDGWVISRLYLLVLGISAKRINNINKNYI